MTREEAIEVIKRTKGVMVYTEKEKEAIETLIPELAESEDERMIKAITHILYENYTDAAVVEGVEIAEIVAWLEKQKDINCLACDQHLKGYLAGRKVTEEEKQKENPKSADSIPSDCVSDAKCEDRWHKVGDSLPDNGRLVLANDCLGNTLLARYDGEGNWEVSVYDNDDYYCRNTITKWCEIPSEKQKEQKPAEWSEDDETCLEYALWCVMKTRHFAVKDACDLDACQCAERWLKSLRPSWKPSEHQMTILKAVKDYVGVGSGYWGEALGSLIEDLEKLI